MQSRTSTRGAPSASIEFGEAVTNAFVEADTEEEAMLTLQPLFESGEGAAPGAGWILDNCGIDIDG